MPLPTRCVYEIANLKRLKGRSGSKHFDAVISDVEIQATSVHTGSGLKDSKLKSGDFFHVENNPLISLRSRSTKIVQTRANRFEINGTFYIRGVNKPEKLALTVSGRGTGSGRIKGTMTFDRKDYGMNSGIPFIRIANRGGCRPQGQARQRTAGSLYAVAIPKLGAHYT